MGSICNNFKPALAAIWALPAGGTGRRMGNVVRLGGFSPRPCFVLGLSPRIHPLLPPSRRSHCSPAFLRGSWVPGGTRSSRRALGPCAGNVYTCPCSLAAPAALRVPQVPLLPWPQRSCACPSCPSSLAAPAVQRAFHVILQAFDSFRSPSSCVSMDAATVAAASLAVTSPLSSMSAATAAPAVVIEES